MMRVTGLILTALAVLVPGPEAAATVWTGAEAHVGIDNPTTASPDKLRLYTEANYGLSPRLQGLLFRWGPIWDGPYGLGFALNGTTKALASDGGLRPDFVGEADLTYGQTWRALRLDFRNRLEHHWQANEQFVRDRNLLRMEIRGDDWAWGGFIYDEIHSRLGREWLERNELGAGVTYVLDRGLHVQLYAAAVSQPVPPGGWQHEMEGGLMLYLAPRAPEIPGTWLPSR